MPSWLSGVVQYSILKRFRSFSELAARSLSEWDHLEVRTQRVIDDEVDRLLNDSSDNIDEDEALHQACYAGDEFFETMLPLGQSMLNLFAIGLYHLFEQQLIDFVRTMNGRLDVPCTVDLLIDELSRSVNTDISSTYEMLPRLHELRLIANTAKHADGESAKKLHAFRPDLFEPYEVRKGWEHKSMTRRLVREPLSGDGLYVTRGDFDHYVQDVAAFWTRLTIDLDRAFA